MLASVGSERVHALVKGGTKERREEAKKPSLLLSAEEMDRLQTLLLQRGIRRPEQGGDVGFDIDLIALLAPLNPSAEISFGGRCAVKLRGIVVEAPTDLANYAEENAVNFEVGASGSIATIRIDTGLGWLGKREYFLELRVAGKGEVEVAVGNRLIASAKLTDEDTLLTDSFIIASTPENDNPTQVIEIRAGSNGSSGSLREIRLLQLK